MKRIFSLLLIFLFVIVYSNPAFASNGSWVSDGVTSPSWANADNWGLGFIPGATSGTTNTDIATFNAPIENQDYGSSSEPVIIDSNRNIGGINFDTSAGNYTIGSTSLNPLLLTSGGTIQILNTLTATNAIETVNAPLIIEGASGTYTLANNSANGSGAGAGTLDIGGSISGGAAGNTVLTLSGTNTNANTISGVISNGSATSLGITESGTGKWVLSGANTYTGATTINAGTLEAGIATQAFGVGSAVSVASGANLDLGGFNETIGSLAGAGTVTSSGTGALVLTTGGNNTSTAFSGVIQNGSATSVGLVQNGTGTLTLSGANTYTGGTTINAGTLTVGAGGTLGATTGALSVNNTNTGVGSDVVLNLDSGAATTTGSLSGTIATPSSGTNTVTINNGGEMFTVNQTTNDTYAGVIAGTGGFTLGSLSTSTLTLTGDNTYTGGTTLDAGILDLGSSGAIGSSGTITFNGGTLQYSANNTTDYSSQFSTAADQDYNIDTNSQNVTFATALTSSGGELTKIGTGTLILTADNTYTGTTTISGGILQIGNGGSTGSLGTGNVTDNANLTIDLTGSPYDISNIISGTGSLTQNGTNTITLAGANTYSGATTINAGTIQAGVANQAFGVGSAVTVASGANLDLNGFNETIGSLAGAGTVTSSASGNIVFTTGGNNSSTTFSGDIQNGSATSVELVQNGTGTLTLSGNNTYTGGTTLDAGVLDLDSSGAIGSSGTISFNGGTLQYSSNNNTDYSSRFSTAADQAFNIDTNGRSVNFADTLDSSGGSLTKLGTGTLTLNGNNVYGSTTVDDGVLTIAPGSNLGSTTGTLTVNNTNAGTGDAAVLNLSTSAPTTTGSLSGTITNANGGNTDTINNGGQMFTVNQTSNGTYAGSIAGIGGFALGNLSDSTLTLSGDSTYIGGTTISAGILDVENANALGTGAVVNNATLNLDTTSLSFNGAYTQNADSSLYLTIEDNHGTLNYGNITSAVAASVAAGSTINVNIMGYVPNGSVLDIINTGGAGVAGGASATLESNSSLVSFSSSILNGNLVFTADNSGFAQLANNANARAVGTALDSVPLASLKNGEIINVLNELEDLSTVSNAKITSALNTMGPVVDAGVIQNSNTALNNMVTATLDRVQNNLDHAAGTASISGFTPIDEGTPNGVWAKPYGSYITQDTLDGIEGYGAWNAGTVVGYDHMMNDNFTLGVSGGYAYGEVNSDINDASTNINSAQGMVYAGFLGPNLNYFIDGEASFGWNWYDGQRDIVVGDINRTADADYNGQQYGTYVEGGYKFSFWDTLKFVPLVSLQWTHLTLDSYTETGAQSLDLNVQDQNYDVLESGVGASISLPQEFEWGNFTPELHAKWLYDFINDNMTVTSSFSGGGPSFTANGANPSKDGANIGGKLSFDFTNNFSLIAEADALLKDGFFGVYGSGTVRYKF